MADLEGVMLSDYLLLHCISKGGVADVYRARQNGEGNYEVTVKIFRPGYAQLEPFRHYFMAEAEKIGQFDHPHILPFLEFGEGDELLYVVTPYIRTGALEDLLGRVGGRFSAMQALPIMQQLCDAVQYAHDHDVVHGNIKPSNVLIGADGRMLLSDFGIARGYDDNEQSLTRVGWGSAEYSAPEQSLGVLKRSSDIYSLGVLLFRILTGAPPFTGQTPVEVLLKHVRQRPPSAREFVANVSDAVDGVLRIAMQKRAEDRFASAQEFRNALTAAVAIAPVASPVARSVVGGVPQLAFGRPTRALDPQTPIPASVPFSATMETPAPMAEPEPLVSGGVPAAEQAALEQAMGTDVTEVHQKGALLAEEEQGMAAVPFWSVDPSEWSPIEHEQSARVGAVALTAREYLEDMPTAPRALADPATMTPSPPFTPKPGARDEQASASRLKRLLPIIVVLLLLLGLLGALLSPLLFPEDTSGGSSGYAPVVRLVEL